jgi:hypothetical protein
MQDSFDNHYKMVVKALLDGRVVPFLGAGANLCDRPEKTRFKRGEYLPSGCELAEYLSHSFNCPPSDDLARVSQYIVLLGPGPSALYQALRELFDVNYPPTIIHKLLAVLPGLLRDRGLPPRHQLIVTTNYDDVLERSFHAAREEFDLISYVATEGLDKGKFLHWSYAFQPQSKREDFPTDDLFKKAVELERKDFDATFWDTWPLPNVKCSLIEKPNEYCGVAVEKRPVILKIHGAVDRITPPEILERLDSFVITDEDYIDYLTRTDITNLVPKNLAVKMGNSNFLFLGYSLRDWNLRVILRRIWGAQKLKFNSWAVQLKPEDLDQIFWMKRDIQIINAELHDYITQLVDSLDAHDHIAALDNRLREFEQRSGNGVEQMPNESHLEVGI